MNPDPNIEKDLFAEALELPPDQREGFLKGACRSDEQLCQRVEDLLRVHGDATRILKTEAELPTIIGAPLSEGPGTVISRYKLLQKIGEGGCGVVYMAEQTEPVKRRVALKVIKLGMDTKSVIARFEAERQALAMMDHPNIAKVLDGGATDTGRPYFVMELVRGTKITEYCDENNLPTRDRLDLFIKVCQAIQHAHQKGIIHRDIKPSNILVTVNDGVAVPKVIDFGIAKATNQQQLTDKTLFTAFEQFIGTPAYMSPEQAVLTSVDIDTRSDIYSLGVLLYEMLTGKTPFDANELLASGLDEMRRTIREQEPVRPSTRLSTMLEGELTTTAKHRQSDAPKLVNLLRGDVDWIVMKCLEKDRARRYETANGLASDIQRHLNNEAVLARPPSAAYRFQKLVRRNKLAFAAASAVTLTLIAGLSFSTWAFLRERKAHAGEAAQRRTAVEEQRKAEAAQAREAVQLKVAEIQRNDAETQRKVAVEQRKLADMQLALQAWEEGDLQRAKDLIEASRPAPGEAPAFEWRYLRKLCQDQSYATFGDTNHPYRSGRFFDHDSLLLNDEKKLTLHDLSRQKEEVLLEDPDGIWNPAFCSGNTNLLATVTDDGRIKVWDLAARRVRAEFEGHPHDPKDGNNDGTITFSRDGRWLASVIAGNSAELWDVQSRNPKPVRTVDRYDFWMSDIVFSSDGGHLFSGGSEPRIHTWNVATGAEEGAPLEGHTSWIYALAMSPDGLRLASGGPDSTVIVWDVNTRKIVTKIVGHMAAVRVLAFSPDGQILASGGRDRTIRLWDMKTGQQLSLLRGHGAGINRLSFSPDGHVLISRGPDGLVKLWHVTPGQKRNALTGGRNSVMEVALSPDGRRLASIEGSNFTVYLWDLSTRSPTLLNGHSNFVVGAAFSPDGRILATGSHDQTVRLWDVSDHTAVATLTTGFPVGSLAFSPDGRTLIVGGSPLNFLVGDRGGLQFWDVPSRQATRTIPGDASSITNVTQLALSASGSLLATGHNDGAVRLWDAETRRFLHEFKGLSVGSVLRLAFSPTEPLLAAGDWGGNIVLYNTTTMQAVLPPLKAHTVRVMSLAFSRDGRTLASGGEGGGLKLWNVAVRQLALTLKGHLGQVNGIAFSQDGTFMATSGVDATVRLWPAATLAEAAAATK